MDIPEAAGRRRDGASGPWHGIPTTILIDTHVRWYPGQ